MRCGVNMNLNLIGVKLNVIVLSLLLTSSLDVVAGAGDGSGSGKSGRKPSSTPYRQQEQQIVHPPAFFLVKNVPKGGRMCGRSSPEVFYNNIAHPSLSLLYHRGQALFGILMDKIEASYNTSASDFKHAQKLSNKTREEWAYMAKTVSSSWDSSIDRLETEWEYFLLVHDMAEMKGSLSLLMPWEIKYKRALVHERLWRIEYGYAMIEAVVRNGIKEIIGTLQHQLGGVIRTLEEEVAKLASKDEEVTGEKLLKQMKQGFAKMKPSFATKLMEKVISRSMEGQPESMKSQSSSSTFISEPLNQMAIVLHAFREKGNSHPKFWAEMASIFETEFGFSIKNDEGELMSRFVKVLNGDQDKLISLIVQIFSNPNKKGS